jgi:hypothetical protein
VAAAADAAAAAAVRARATVARCARRRRVCDGVTVT